MWQMKREIIPAVVGALEVINKGSEKRVREIPGNINNNNNNNNNKFVSLLVCYMAQLIMFHQMFMTS